MSAVPVSPMLNIPNLQAGIAYLGRLPLANPVVAERELAQFLDWLLASPPDADDLFALLEQARMPLSFVEEEMARRYHNKPLILGDVEEGAFQQVIADWRRMEKAYALCARLLPPTAGPEYRTRVATILHRCIFYTGMMILEHYRARRELSPGLWLDLHGYYETAEEWGVAMTPVEDALDNERRTTHCTAAYTMLLLIDVAGPYSHSIRDLNLIRRWAGLWSPLVGVHRLDDENHVPAFVLELMKDQPLHPPQNMISPGSDGRRLETGRLAAQIGTCLSQLRERILPSKLGLGEETSSHVIRLLDQVSRPWTQQAAPRRFRRFPASGTARVAVGFDAMHYFVTGQEFVQPAAARTYSRGEFDALFTFRDRIDPQAPLSIREQVNFPADDWDVINHSANGFRLARSEAGQKVQHGQLLALCPPDGENFILAVSCWLMQEQRGGLVAGISVLPGLPHGIALRPESGQASGDPYVRGFLLPPVEAIGEPASLVIPAGMYVASKILDVDGQDGHWRARMKKLLQRGSDFERVTFEVA